MIGYILPQIKLLKSPNLINTERQFVLFVGAFLSLLELVIVILLGLSVI